MKTLSTLLKSLITIAWITIPCASLFAQHSVHNIDTVTIQKPISPIENTPDKLLYHVDRDQGLKGKTAEDIFKRLPMVALNYDGQVSLRGDRNVKILINGKPWNIANSSIDAALRMLSSDQIKTIEIMPSPSLRYDAEGSGGIINIVTKQRKIYGANGVFSTTLGSRQSSSNVNVIAGIGRWSISSGAGSTWSLPVSSVITSQLQRNDGTLIYSQVNESKNRRLGLQSNTSIHYEIDSTASLLSMVNINHMHVNTDNSIVNQYSSTSTSIGSIENKLPTRSFDISLDYLKRLLSNRSELGIAFQYMKGQNETYYRSWYDNRPQTTELGHNKGDNYEFTLQVDYQTKIKQAVLHIGGKTISRHIRSTVDIDTLSIDGRFVDDNPRSYFFDYRQTVLAGYATANLPVSERLYASSGIRYEKTLLKSNSYQNLFPYLALSFTNHKGRTYTLKYGQRIQRPSLYFLNPFRNTSDKLNQMQGNPILQAETSHNIDLEHSFSFNKYNTLINTTAYYRKTNDIIEPLLRNISEDGKLITLQSFENIGSSTHMGINLYSSLTLFTRLSLRVNLDLFTYSISPYSIFIGQTEQADKTFFNHKLFAGMDLNLGKNFVLESNVFFDSPQKTFHGAYAAFNLWNLGIKKKMMKDALAVGLSIADPLNKVKNLRSYSSSPTFLQQNNFALPFRSFGCSVSWHFGNAKTDLSKNREKKIRNDDQKPQVH